MSGHKCPYPTCDKQLPPGKFACARHWHDLPSRERDEIQEAWSLRQGTDGLRRHREAMLAGVSYLRQLHRRRKEAT